MSESFKDQEFPPVEGSIGDAEWLKGLKVDWRRASEMCENGVLYKSTLHPGGVLEGQLEDCYFVAALTVLTQRPESAKDLFVGNSGGALTSDGKYTIRFFRDCEWKEVTIDDYLPVDASSKKLLFCRCSEANEFWAPLVEKAFAKVYGSYQAISGGNTAEAMLDLTGMAVEDINLAAEELEWGSLDKWCKQKALIGCASYVDEKKKKKAEDNKNILQNHAYCILRCAKVGKDTLVHLRNPWGSLQWNGAWGDQSPKWTKAAKVEANYTDITEDGSFWMSMKDFSNVFNRVHVARPIASKAVHHIFTDEWKGESSGGCSQFPSWRKNPSYCIQFGPREGPVTVSVIVSQQDVRLNRKEKQDSKLSYNQIGIQVVRQKEDLPMLINGTYETLSKTSFWNKRDVSTQFCLGPNKSSDSIIVIPSTFYPDQECAFKMVVRVDTADHKIKKIPQPTPTCTIEGTWSGVTAGGSHKFASFKNNPQYALDIDGNKDCRVDIVLCQPQPKPKPSTWKNAGIGVYVMQMNGKRFDSPMMQKDDPVVGKFTFTNATEVIRSVSLSPGDGPFTLIPCTYDANNKRDFVLSVFMKEGSASLKELKGGKSSGGSTSAAASMMARPKVGTKPSAKPRTVTAAQPKAKGVASTPVGRPGVTLKPTVSAKPSTKARAKPKAKAKAKAAVGRGAFGIPSGMMAKAKQTNTAMQGILGDLANL